MITIESNGKKEKTMKKSVRLTNEVRDIILRKVFENAYKKRDDALEKRRFKLSEKVYNDIYPPAMREQMAQMPSGWLPKVSELQVQFGGESSGVCRRQFPRGSEKLIPFKDYRGVTTNILKVYDARHKLTEEHRDLTNDIDSLTEEKCAAYAEAKAIVSAATTTKALKEAWPQIAKIVEQFEPSSEEAGNTSLVPVTESLNKRLGL